MSTRLSERRQPGSTTITNITGPQTMRLMEMGLTPGSKIEVVRAAPLGFPIEVKVRGYSISLRESEAECVEIE
ncbi:MAG: FeoA family protein [Bacteroidota bacterium]